MTNLPKINDNFYRYYNYKVEYFFNNNLGKQTDFDIYLDKYKCNLQREYCWNSLQQEELITSIIMNRHVPPVTIVYYTFPFTKTDFRDKIKEYEEITKARNQVIDGKQRLLTVKKFIENEFTYLDYYFKDLPLEYQRKILNYEFKCIEIGFSYYGDCTDDELVELFKWCNFAGTPQEKDYLDKFKVR